MPVLERAFRSTYGLELEEVFGDTDLAIGTYRYAVSRMIPDMTRLAWKEKRDEILAATPGTSEQDFVYTMSRQQYERAYGTKYRKPGLLARFVVLLVKVLPKFGPFKPLAFEPLTSETERMFAESLVASNERYRVSLTSIRSGQLALEDVDLDTGRSSTRGSNRLADETYADLLKEFADKKFVGVPVALCDDINHYYASKEPGRPANRKAAKQEREAERHLAALNESIGHSQ